MDIILMIYIYIDEIVNKILIILTDIIIIIIYNLLFIL